MIYLFNNNEEMIRIIPNSAIKRMYQTQKLTDENYISDRLDVEIQALNDEELSELEYMAVDDIENPQRFHYYFIVKETTEHQVTSLTGVQSGIEELRKTPVYDMRPTNRSPKFIADRLLEGTNWQAGYTTDGVGTISTNFYYTDVFSALKKMCMAFGIEMQFFVEITTNRIGARYIEFRKRTGKSVGKRVVYGHNALKIVKEVEKTNTVTALIGRGKGVQVSVSDEGNIGYGRKIGFENVEWKTSSGAPVDKPLGQEFVEIPELTLQYGIKNSNGTVRPKIGFVEFQDEESETRLIDRTYNALLELSRPQVLLETSSVYLPDTGIGDTVNVVRHDRDLRYQTRVFEITWDRLANQAVDMKLGDRLGESENKRIGRISNQVSGNISTELGPTIDELVDRLTTADGKNTNWYTTYDPMENPETMGLVRVNDNWYQPDPEYEGEFILKQWNGEMWVEILRTSGNPELVRRLEEVGAEAEQAKEDAIKAYDDSIAEAERLVGEQTTAFDTKFGEIEDSVEAFNQSVSDADAKAEAIKRGLGLDDPTLTNQQITDQIRQDFSSLKSTADTASQAFIDFNNEYQTFLTNEFAPTFAKATDALSLAEQNKGLFYSANLIDEVTGLSNVYTKAEIDGTNGYVTKATFNANAQSISSELERVEGVALASGANINLLVRKDEQSGKYLDTGGVIKDFADYAISTHKINVTSGEKLTFSQILARNFRYAFYKSDGTFLSFGMSASQKFTITVPTEASYMLPSYSTTNYPKIERGEVKTQWTLAPQDQANQSTINYLTSKVEQTPGMISEALVAYTPTDSLDDTVSSYLSNNTTKTAGAIDTKLTDYQTKDTLDGSVANLFTNTNSATAQKIDSSLTAIKGLIPTTIDNQNMLNGTSDVWIQGDVTNNWNMYAYSGPTAKISALPNSTYIVSADVIKEYNDIGLFIFEYQNSTLIKENYVTGLWKYPTDKVRRSFKIKTGANTNNISVGFRFNASNIQTKFKYRRVQLEHSEIETDWKPSFKDTVALSDYTIFKNDTTDTAALHAKKLSSITAEGIVTSSSVNQTADGITQRVAKVDENGNVAYANTEIKLDSIVSTVANGAYISNLIQTSNLLQSTITSFTPNQNILKGTDFANEENTMGDVIEYGRKPRFSKADYFSYGRIATIDIPETSGDANLGFAVKLPTKDKWYTLSFYGLANWLGTAGVDFYMTDPYKTLKNYKATLLTEYDWATYRIQVTVKATVANAIIYVRPQGNKFNANYNNIVFWGVKLEGGEVATKWSDNVSSSKITQLEDNINLKVSNKDLLSQINVQANGVLITSGTNKLNITPTTTYIQDSTIKSAMIDTLNVSKLTGTVADFTSLRSKVITAESIRATHIEADALLVDKVFSNQASIDKLWAKSIWTNKITTMKLDAGQITTGELNAANVSIVNLDVNKLTGNVMNFISGAFTSNAGSLLLSGNGIRVNFSNGYNLRINGAGTNYYTSGGQPIGGLLTTTQSEGATHSLSLAARRGYNVSLDYQGSLSYNQSNRALSVDGTTGNITIERPIYESSSSAGLEFTRAQMGNIGWGLLLASTKATGSGLFLADNGEVWIGISGGYKQFA